MLAAVGPEGAASSEVESSPASAPTRSISGRYRVHEAIGQGAMGTVWRVFDTVTRRHVALKMLTPPNRGGLAADRLVLWFRREFGVIATLRHPGIVEAYEYGVAGGVPYYTMELLDGHDLREAEHVDVARAAAIVRDIASALAFLHARRLVHRDIKPRNVRLTADGRAKVIDFGIVATMGTLGDVAGTPMSLAPEALRGLPLDGRADLFALGALAYWMLSGRYPYVVDSVDHLERAWRTPPPRLAALRDDVPRALDEVVMSLIAIDADHRPPSAAAVIDRLDAILGASDATDERAAFAWLHSSALVGRDAEVARIRGVVDGAIAGHGGAVLIEGGAGLGRSRLLREAAWHAQTAGALVLHAQRDRGNDEPYGVVRRIVRRFVAAAPEIASKLAVAHASLVGRILPGGSRSSDTWPVTVADDPAELRIRQQREVDAYLRDVCREVPLAIFVDELESCDEASASTLAALAHDAAGTRLALVVALRTGCPVVARDAIALLRERATSVELEGLSAAAIDEWVTATFGAFEGSGRIAAWLFARAGGHPGYTHELSRWLVDHKVLRYAEGAWVAGDLVSLGDPPALADALGQRLAALPEDARAVAELIATLSAKVPVEWCTKALPDAEPEQVFAAVDALSFAQIVTGDVREVAMAHDGLRDAVLRGISDERARRLHQIAAELLRAEGEDRPDLELRLGRHLLGAGDRETAATVLERVGRRLYDAQSFFDAIAPLETALAIHREHPERRLRCLDLAQMLTRAGVLCDRDVLLRHAAHTIDALEDDSGLPVARKVARVLGGRVGLVVGLGWATVRRWWARRVRERPTRALVRLLAVVNYAASVHSLGFARHELEALLPRLAPLAALRDRIPSAAVLLVESFLLIAQGRWRAVERNVEEIDRIFQTDRTTPLAELDRRLGLGAAHYMRASVRALDQDPRFFDTLSRLDVLGLQFFTVAAGVARVVFHRLRGEESIALQRHAETSVGLVQLGNAWVFATQTAWIDVLAYAMTGDALGIKRAIDELEKQAAVSPGMAQWITTARAEHARVRHDPATAIALLRDQGDAAIDLVHAAATVAALTESLLAAGEHASALAAASRWLAQPSEVLPRMMAVRIGCVAARAAIGCDRTDDAQRFAAGALAEAERAGNPLLCGMAHEAMAEVARRRGEVERARDHAGQAMLVFATTRNPLLVARARPDAAAASEATEAPITPDEATVELIADRKGTDPLTT
jgi:hypothetical protein